MKIGKESVKTIGDGEIWKPILSQMDKYYFTLVFMIIFFYNSPNNLFLSTISNYISFFIYSHFVKGAVHAKKTQREKCALYSSCNFAWD